MIRVVSVILTLLGTVSILIGTATADEMTSTSSITFVIAPEDRPVKEIKIDGESYIRNFENFTIIVTSTAADGTTTESVLHNKYYNAVRFDFDTDHIYDTVVLNGPGEVVN